MSDQTGRQHVDEQCDADKSVLPDSAKSANRPIHLKLLDQLRTHRSTLIGCVLLTFMTAPRHTGFMLILFVPPFCIWLLWSAIAMYRSPSRRETLATKMAIWLIFLTGIVGYQRFLHVDTRDRANQIVAAVNLYKASHGDYPKRLEDIQLGFVPERAERFYYRAADGKPAFFYAVTWIIFDTYTYDFEHAIWTYRSS